MRALYVKDQTRILFLYIYFIQRGARTVSEISRNKNTRGDCNYFIRLIEIFIPTRIFPPSSYYFHDTYDDPYVFNGRPIFWRNSNNNTIKIHEGNAVSL